MRWSIQALPITTPASPPQAENPQFETAGFPPCLTLKPMR